MKTKIILMIFICLFIYLFFANNIILNWVLDYPKLKKVKFEEFNTNSEIIYDLNESIYIGGIDEKFNLAGYAFCESDYSQKNRFINILLKNEKNTFLLETSLQNRGDLKKLSSKLIDNNNLFFSSKFSLIQLPKSQYEVYLYVKENDYNYGLTKLFTFDWNGKNYLKNNLEKNFDLVTFSDDLKYSIEINRKNKNFIEVIGWAFIENINTYEQPVYLEVLNGESKFTFIADKKMRTDVATYFNNNNLYKKSGMYFNIPFNLINEQLPVTAKLIIPSNKEILLCSDTFPILNNDKSNELVKNFNENLNIIQSYNIDVFNKLLIDDYYYLDISGWIFLEDLDTSNQKVFLEFITEQGKKTYKLDSLIRKDVSQSYNNKKYINSGFKGKIPINDASYYNYEIRIIVVNGENISASPIEEVELK